MDITKYDINRFRTQEKKTKVISVRVTPRDLEWIKKNKISATRLFNISLKELQTLFETEGNTNEFTSKPRKKHKRR